MPLLLSPFVSDGLDIRLSRFRLGFLFRLVEEGKLFLSGNGALAGGSKLAVLCQLELLHEPVDLGRQFGVQVLKVRAPLLKKTAPLLKEGTLAL